MGAYLGIDLHRRRSLAVCLDEEGDRLWWRRFENSPVEPRRDHRGGRPRIRGSDRSHLGLVLGG
jgi:hypothetical protein